MPRKIADDAVEQAKAFVQPTDEPNVGQEDEEGADDASEESEPLEDEEEDEDLEDEDEDEEDDEADEADFDEDDENDSGEGLDDFAEEGEEEGFLCLSDLTAAYVEKQIAREAFMALPDQKGFVCQLTLKNGFRVIGGQVSVLEGRPDEDEGMAKAREKAFRKAFEFEAYALADRLFRRDAK